MPSEKQSKPRSETQPDPPQAERRRTVQSQPYETTEARNIAPGSRILNAGAPVRVVETWPVCFGFWRAFIVEDASGARHHFEIHRERPIALLDRVAEVTP
jgi:hypothetical protein